MKEPLQHPFCIRYNPVGKEAGSIWFVKVFFFLLRNLFLIQFNTYLNSVGAYKEDVRRIVPRNLVMQIQIWFKISKRPIQTYRVVNDNF